MPGSTSPTPSRLSTAARQTASAAHSAPRRREHRCSGRSRTFRDYSLEKPVGDEAFRVIRGAYACARAS